MTTTALAFCTRISLAHARLNRQLGDELGTYHGLSLGDFLLLRFLARSEAGRVAVASLVRPLGLPLSAVTRELVRLEKMGPVQREAKLEGSARCVAIRPSGLRVLREATVTAEAVCAEAVADLSPAAVAAAGTTLADFCAA